MESGSGQFPQSIDDLIEWEPHPQTDDCLQPDFGKHSFQLSPPQRLGSSCYEENAIINALRAQSNNLYTRLLSIENDTKRTLQLYTSLIRKKLLPLFGNARAGAWYVPPSKVTDFPVNICSFKSADGHYGAWAASPRRPNIHVLEAILRHGGVVIVDATRAGKRIPDALSKTIPIWCAVLNILIHHPYDCANPTHAQTFLHTHPSIPESEQAAIIARIPKIATAWRHAGMHTLPPIVQARKQQPSELRPLWTAPSRPTWPDGLPVDQLQFRPVLCISASDAVVPGQRPYVNAVDETLVGGIRFPQRNGFPYVQGAGDDEEAWAHKLSPQIFWQSRDYILSDRDLRDAPTAETALQIVTERVQEILRRTHSEESGAAPLAVLPVWQSGISIAQIPNTALSAQIDRMRAKFRSFGAIIVLTGPLSQEERNSSTNEKERADTEVHLFELKTLKGATDNKYGLERVLGPCLTILRNCCVDLRKHALICCTSSAGDWTAGLAISWLLWHCVPDRDNWLGKSSGRSVDYDTKGVSDFRVCPVRRESITIVEKDKIRGMMVRFLATFPDFQLSRASFKQITRFFISLSPKSSLLADYSSQSKSS